MRSALKPTAALVAALLSLILVACGGSGDSSTTTNSSTSNTTASREGAPAKTQEKGGNSEATQDSSGDNSEAKQNGSSANSDAKQDGSGGGGKQGSGGGSSSKSPKAHSRAEVSTPLKVSGGGSAPLRVKGGDNSIQEFGEESSDSELREAAEAVHGFFVARGTGEWAKACSYMTASLREQSEQLAENKDCAAFLEGFTTALPASTWREITTIDASSLRQDGEQAFLIYYGAPGKTVYAMPMKDEGGEWKVGALSGNALPGTG